MPIIQPLKLHAEGLLKIPVMMICLRNFNIRILNTKGKLKPVIKHNAAIGLKFPSGW